MAAPEVFVVRHRIEQLEERIATALDEPKLAEFSRGVARAAMHDLLADTASEIDRARLNALDDIKVERVDVDEKLSQMHMELSTTISTHVAMLEGRIDRLEKLVAATAILGVITLIAAIIM